MSPQSPLLPSLVRWGQNANRLRAQTPSDQRDPEAEATDTLDTTGLRAILDRIVERARVKQVDTGVIRPLAPDEKAKLHPHAFRHYAATAASLAGVPIMDIQTMLGHDSLKTTAIYVEVPVETSAAFAEGVSRSLSGRPALTQEELAEMSARVRSPLDDPTIVAVDPEDGSAVPRMPEPEAAIVAGPIARPTWAYAGKGELVSLLLPVDHPQRFVAGLTRAEQDTSQAIDAAVSAQDGKAHGVATLRLAELRAKHSYVQFRVGQLSRLPWWCGKQNHWQGEKMAPVMAPQQFAPETTSEAVLVTEIKRLFEKVWAQKGPAAALNLTLWLSESVSYAAVNFLKLMAETEHNWVAWEEAAAPAEKVVRMHDPSAIAAWLERFATDAPPVQNENQGQVSSFVSGCLRSLPEWFWIEDPLMDLPTQERRELREWIEKLQGLRPSANRQESALDELTDAFTTYAKLADQYRELAADSPELKRLELGRLGAQLRDMDAGLRVMVNRLYPTAKDFDPAAVAAPVPGRVDYRRRLLTELVRRGADVASPSAFRARPVLGEGPGLAIDPALLTFTADHTIVHSEEVKAWWASDRGTDSECVARRSVRILWERRKNLARSRYDTMLPRSLDLWLGAICPCAREMNERLMSAGWRVPRYTEDTRVACQVMWSELIDTITGANGLLTKGLLARSGAAAEGLPLGNAPEFWGQVGVRISELSRVLSAPVAQALPDGATEALEPQRDLSALKYAANSSEAVVEDPLGASLGVPHMVDFVCAAAWIV